NGDCYAEVGFGAAAYGDNNQGRAYFVLGGTAPDPAVRYVVEGASGEALGMSLTGLRRSASGTPARAIVSGFTLAGSPGGAGFVSQHDFARYAMQSPSGGGTWPVGALREVKWLGREPANIELSVDGGASWTTLLTNVGGQGLNTASIRVPHTPTRFARLRATPPNPVLPPSPIVPPSPVVPPSPILPPNPITPPSPVTPCTFDAGVAASDSFFTIQTSVSLLALLAAPAPNGAGAVVTWNSDPGPEDLAGYRLERATGSGAWSTVSALTRTTSFADPQAGPATRYRLFAVNGLNEELLLGETSFRPRAPLTAWPIPYRGGQMSIAFATHGGWGGGSARSEVALFDVQGRLVRRIADGSYEAGLQSAIWDGRDDKGQRVAAGIYFIRSKSAGEERTLKLVVAR
ncbi:MAG TPA: FlgD immunoglobulin-like domain containing protein, partial [Candidatus Eisenbacteria bacterium]|nr:FlgD immunoglobulin-like domain containing protein [Candidatus Eisenbacteria bacterium]